MVKTYTASYFKIYIWDGLSIIMKFLSLFIVIPYLTNEPAIYGIYTICISLGIFLNYADLGFLRASQKYATEAYARGDREDEMRNIGFGAFILLIISVLLTILFFSFAFSPHVLIKSLDTPQRIYTATRLLFILAAFTPFIVLRRTMEMIFKIRLNDFISKKIFLLGSIITIASVFYFFRNGQYKIISYYLFIKTIDLVAIIVSLWIAKTKYNYSLLLLLKYIHFDHNIFIKIKRLAFTGLYLTLMWVLFYEFDKIFIGKFIGPEQTAIYAVALIFPVLFRQIFGVFFTPIVSRANHFIGLNDEVGLKKFIFQVLIFAAPITVLPTIALALTVKPFILSWVGIKYTASINIAVLLGLAYSFSFISYTTDLVLYAKVKIKEMYIAGTVPVIIFWIGILLSYHKLGLISFGVYRFLGMIFIQLFYFRIILRYLDFPLKVFVDKVFRPLIFPVGFLIFSLLLFDRFLPYEKSKLNLLVVIVSVITILGFSFVIQYYTSINIRNYINEKIINRILKKFNLNIKN